MLINNKIKILISSLIISIMGCTNIFAANITSLTLFRNKMVLVAYDNSVPIATFSVSCNLSKTPLGERKTGEKYFWHQLFGDNNYGQYCIRYGDAKKGEMLMFHSVLYSEMYNPCSLKMFYNKDKSYGYNTYDGIMMKYQSGGCVRLRTQDIKWLYENIKLHTPVSIIDTDEDIKRPKFDKIGNEYFFDPTDIDTVNMLNNGLNIDQIKEYNKNKGIR